MDETTLFDPRAFEDPSDAFVYHFTTFKTARDFILGGERQILANLMAKMNDPFEHTPKQLPLAWKTIDAIEDDLASRVHKVLIDATVSDARLFCCSLDVPAQKCAHQNGPIYTRFNRRGFDHPSMWAHYADNHRGVCLIFYRERLNQSFRKACEPKGLKSISAPVNYERFAASRLLRESDWYVTKDQSDMTQSSLKQWARDHIIANYTLFYFTKHDDWTPEAEYRWLILGDHKEDLLIPLKGDELAGVILGSDFPLIDHQNACKLCDDWRIPIRAMIWTNGESNHPIGLSAFRASGFWEQREQDATSRRKAEPARCTRCGEIVR